MDKIDDDEEPSMVFYVCLFCCIFFFFASQADDGDEAGVAKAAHWRKLLHACWFLTVFVDEEDLSGTDATILARLWKTCFQILEDCGFKVVSHMMPDLPNMGYERDLEGFKEYFENGPLAAFRVASSSNTEPAINDSAIPGITYQTILPPKP